MSRSLALVFVVLCSQLSTFAAPRTESADVIVYTATAGGVAAALAAARNGASVILAEPGRHVGGMLSGGLGHSDVLGQEKIIGGITQEIYARMAAHYGQANASGAFDFEPSVAEKTLNDLLREAGVRVVFDQQLARVEKTGARIAKLRMAGGAEFTGKVFIDAGYEGDVMAQAGVKYRVGREGKKEYGESLAGRTELLPGQHQFKFPVSPWRDGKLLPYVTPQEQFGETGDGDHKFQGYSFRLCLTDRVENQIPITKPERYDELDFELVRRYHKAGGNGTPSPLGIARLPNGKSDFNHNGPVSFSLLGAQWEYPDATPARRKEIWDLHLRWAHGLMWYLQNDASVPAKLRDEARKWALCKDEFQDTGGWPHQMYIREGRKMLGAHVLTQRDLQTERTKPDSVGMGGYNIDIREVQWAAVKTFKFPKAEEHTYMEGYVTVPVQPWQLPYRSLTPRAEECENLLVPVCASMSTIAFASFRMEPNFMVAGHATGTAAALAAKSGASVQAVPIVELQAKLRAERQILAQDSE